MINVFFEHLGFKIIDHAAPYFELAVYKFNDEAVEPSFKFHTSDLKSQSDGIIIYYTAQCPFAVGVINDLRDATVKKRHPFSCLSANHKRRSTECTYYLDNLWIIL